MPIGVPRIIYCWGEELPPQWTDIYNFIFRRRMVFLMQYLDDELCNQICGLLINIHMEDRSKELEKQEIEKSGIFKGPGESIGSNKTKKTFGAIQKENSSLLNTNLKKESNDFKINPNEEKKSHFWKKDKSMEDLLSSYSKTNFDENLAIDENYTLEQYTLQKITLEWLNWHAQFFNYSDEPYLYYLAEILSQRPWIKDDLQLFYKNNNLNIVNKNYNLLSVQSNSGEKEKDDNNYWRVLSSHLYSFPSYKANTLVSTPHLFPFETKGKVKKQKIKNLTISVFYQNNKKKEQMWSSDPLGPSERVSNGIVREIPSAYEAAGSATIEFYPYNIKSLLKKNKETIKPMIMQMANKKQEVYSPFRSILNLAHIIAQKKFFSFIPNLNIQSNFSLSSAFELKNSVINKTQESSNNPKNLLHSFNNNRSSLSPLIGVLASKNFINKKLNYQKQQFIATKILSQRNLKREYAIDFKSSIISFGLETNEVYPRLLSNNAAKNEQLIKVTNNSSISKSKNKKILNILNLTTTNKNIIVPQSLINVKNSSYAIKKQTKKALQEEESKKVFVIINSFGGSVGNGITVHDALQFIKAGSLTLGLGVAASAASLVLAGGTISERYVTEGCHTMIHQPECLTADHDVLTDEGWLPIEKVTTDHKVAVLDEKGVMTYQNPTKTHIYQYKGDMYEINSTQVSLKVTPEHKMYVDNYHENKKEFTFSLQEAKTLLNKRLCYKKDAIWEAPDYYIDLSAILKGTKTEGLMREIPSKPIPKDKMNSFLFFFGFWIAEGHCELTEGQNEYMTVFTQKKETTIEITRNYMNKLNFKWTEQKLKNSGVTQFMIFDKQLWTFFNEFNTGARNKTLPNWVWKLSAKQCKIVLDAMLLGDGTKHKIDNTEHYFISSSKLADDFCRLVLHAGLSVSMEFDDPKNREEREIQGGVMTTHNPLHRINILKKFYPIVNNAITSKNKEKTYKEYFDAMVPYEGPVYCLTVPTGIFYVKRAGKPVWTGNSSINGQASDIWIDSQEIMKIRLDVAEIYSLSAHRPRHKILRDLDRDFYLTATETIHYGLADEIATNEVMHEIIEMTSKVWDYHDIKQQRLLETRENANSGLDTQTQN